MIYSLEDCTEKILQFLKDKNWVEPGEIKQKILVPDKKLMPTLEFLEYSSFIDFDAERKRMRISDNGKLYLEIP